MGRDLVVTRGLGEVVCMGAVLLGLAGVQDRTAQPDCEELGCKDKMSSTLATVQLDLDLRWGSASMLDG